MMRFVALVCALLALLPSPSFGQSVQPLAVGDLAPQFIIDTTAGPFNLRRAKKPVAIVVFALWCPHCKNDVPAINEITRKYAGRLQVLWVAGSAYAQDRNAIATQADLDLFRSENHVLAPMALEPNQVVGKKFARGFPIVIVVGEDMRVRSRIVGEASVEKMVAELDAHAFTRATAENMGK